MGDGYNYPGYKYLGPGNSLNEEDPVNSTDLIAYIHDLEYTIATKSDQIHEADKKAIKEFIKDYKENGRVSDLAGIVGLGIKYGVEAVFGNIYGMSNKSSKTYTQYLYSLREKHLADIYKNTYRHNYVNLATFKKSEEAKRIYKAYGKDGHYYNTLKDQYQKEFPGGSVPQAANDQRGTDTGSSSDQPPSAKRPRPEEPSSPDTALSLSPNTDRFLQESVSHIATDTSIFTGSQDNQSTSSTPMDTTMVPIQSGSGRGPNTGARAGSSGFAGPASSHNNGVTWISPSRPGGSQTITFHKSRVMISYGYSTENIQLSDPDYIEVITTPMALIPVDFLPFYLSNAEFESLPWGAKVTHVTCSITPLGTRTAFDTGTTLSGTATSEYVPIGLLCEGLNTHFYGRNRSYTTQGTNPMKPTGLGKLNATEMYKKYYEHIPSNALCIPQVIDEYYCHEWNRSANPDTHALPEYQIHNAGVVRMDEKVHQFLINQAIGQPVMHYEYKPKFGLIKEAKQHFVPWNRRSNKMETNKTRPYSVALQFFQTSDKRPVIGDVGLGAADASPVLINQVNESYIRQLENYGAFHPDTGTTSFAAQPQVHVGMLATPQLNPSSNDVSYLNSACYWKVECTCNVTFNFTSAFSKANPISWPQEVSFQPNGVQRYTDGQTLFGQSDTGSGNVTKEVEEEFEHLDII